MMSQIPTKVSATVWYLSMSKLGVKNIDGKKLGQNNKAVCMRVYSRVHT